MLNTYLLETQRLLQNPPATAALYSTTDLTAYINTARSQLAAETNCIRATATLALSSTVQSYSFSGITLPSAVANGYQETLTVRMAATTVAGVNTMLDQRSWEWFWNYYFGQGAAQASGTPTLWAQQGQGANGTLFFYPVPNATISVSLDVSILPIALALDTDPEAIPYPWTDAVPFYAAYYAYMSAQRQDDADRMFRRYKEFARRGRQESTGTVLPENYQGGVAVQKTALVNTVTGAVPAGGQ